MTTETLKTRKARVKQSGKLHPHQYRPHPVDLFGEVIVTHADVRAWLLVVAPRNDPDGIRAAQYVREYNVVGKIAALKSRGEFDATVTPHVNQALAFEARMHGFLGQIGM